MLLALIEGSQNICVLHFSHLDILKSIRVTMTKQDSYKIENDTS